MAKTYDHFPAELFAKQDPTDDDYFYHSPRLVAHIDNRAIAFLRDEVYGQLLPAGGHWLDLMSSLYSHYPKNLKPALISATGMNKAELETNPQLDDYVLQNLNKRQALPFETHSFDAATCCVSVQYLEKPVEVFEEVRRVLKPDAPFIVSFSNRCFPTKAMKIWLQSNDQEHIELVTTYMMLAGYNRTDTRVKQGGLFAGDPLYAVIGFA